jgi:HK97 family phage major capsid protein
MDYKKLMAAQVELMQKLFDLAEKENREFTAEEKTQYDAAEAEFKRLKASGEKAAELAGMAAAAAAAAPAAAAGARALQIKAGADLAAKKPYASLGSMLIDVAQAKLGNDESKARLIEASLNTETGADGGFLVPSDFIGSMLQQAEAESQLFSRCSQLTVVGNSANIPAVDEESRADGSRFGGIQVFWVREGAAGEYKQPKFRNLDLKLAKIMGLVSVTSEMLEDAALLSSWLMMAFPAEMAFALDQAIYNGDGNGIPLGIMNSGALVEVAKEGSQSADTVVYENIVKMWARMPQRRASRAAWFVTQQVMEQLPLMKLDVGTGGGPVFISAGGASERPYATLMGQPIVAIEQAATLGDKGDIVLADLSDYIAITKGGITTAQSIHVDFDKDKTAFRFIRRVNGAPYTRKALVSRASATFKTSPYITLQAR